LEGKLDRSQTFTDLCQIFEDKLRRDSSDNKNLKYSRYHCQRSLLWLLHSFQQTAKTWRKVSTSNTWCFSRWQHALKVLVMAADGAAPELAAQEMMDRELSDQPPLTYEYPLYGIYIPQSACVWIWPFNISNRRFSFPKDVSKSTTIRNSYGKHDCWVSHSPITSGFI
jgi:hypothetical protein